MSNSIAEQVASGSLSPESIDEATISRHLLTSSLPDPDLLIRTSGEFRLSNFLLYQVTYSCDTISISPVHSSDAIYQVLT